MIGTDMRDVESSAYRGSYADGLLDLFFGASLVWIGACWLWIEPLSGIAAVFPAALLPAVIVIRRRIVEPRAGYARWTADRREWEQRELRGLLFLGIALLVLGIVLAGSRLLGDGLFDASTVVAGLPAVLIALPVLLLAAATGLRRLWAYALALVSAAVITVALALDPGPGLLLSGVLVLLAGIALFARFLRSRPAQGA